MRQPALAGIIIAVLAASGVGCAPVIKAEGAAPNPLLIGGTLEPVLTRPRNAQQKEVYARIDAPSDRFHAYVAAGQVYGPDDVDIAVQIWHPWQELADLRAYKITLRADGGAPVPVDSVGGAEVTYSKSRLETQGQRRTTVPIMSGGKVVGYRDIDSWEEGTVEGDLWRGRARLRFRGTPLVSRATRELTLELRNRRQVFVFRWHFDDRAPTTPAVATEEPRR